jgi:hypothetical protein
LLEICTVGILAVPTVEVSLLCLLDNVAVCGVTADLLAESEGGAQTKRFAGGTSQIPLRVAAGLGTRHTVDTSPPDIYTPARPAQPGNILRPPTRQPLVSRLEPGHLHTTSGAIGGTDSQP